MNSSEGAGPHSADEALAALRVALLANPPRDASGLASVREPLRDLCRCARAEGLEPERLLIRLKQTMDSLPELASGLHGGHSEMRIRIVSFAIDTYFADAGPS